MPRIQKIYIFFFFIIEGHASRPPEHVLMPRAFLPSGPPLAQVTPPPKVYLDYGPDIVRILEIPQSTVHFIS